MEERELQLDLAQEPKKFVRVIQKTNYRTSGLRGRASIIAKYNSWLQAGVCLRGAERNEGRERGGYFTTHRLKLAGNS